MISSPLSNKNLALESLRGYAALSVVLAHFLAHILPSALSGHLRNQHYWWEYYFYHSSFSVFVDGSFAVAVFFVISGYVLTHALLQNHDWSRLFARLLARYWRLLLPALFSIVLMYLTLVTQRQTFVQMTALTGAQLDLDFAQFYQNPVGFFDALHYAFVKLWWQPFSVKTSYNTVLWTMPLELWGSALVFALVALFYFLRAQMVRVTVLILLTLLFFRHGGEYKIFYAGFLLGMCLSLWSYLKPLTNLKALVVLLLALHLGGYGLGASHQWWRSLGISPWLSQLGISPNALLHLLGAFLMVWVVLAHQGLANLLTRPLGVYLGKTSFSVYLLHMPVMHGIIAPLFMLWPAAQSFEISAIWSLFIIYLSLSYLLAHFAEQWIDHPATAFSKSFASKMIRLTQTVFSNHLGRFFSHHDHRSISVTRDQ